MKLEGVFVVAFLCRTLLVDRESIDASGNKLPRNMFRMKRRSNSH